MNEELKNIVREIPNNTELGNKLRSLYDGICIVHINGYDKTINMNKDYPNDTSLGETIRELVNNNIS